jgi:hypothetical protein
MIQVHDKHGRIIEVSVHGELDDVQINEAHYLDSEEEVSEKTIQYIESTQSDILYRALLDRVVGTAEYYADLEEGR